MASLIDAKVTGRVESVIVARSQINHTVKEVIRRRILQQGLTVSNAIIAIISPEILFTVRNSNKGPLKLLFKDLRIESFSSGPEFLLVKDR